ncbi:TerC family protein [Loigolactobacillus zhaoyuanensis]|uniref:TerC family protein n=1 Tax=Loigolactobacillus zhaoyuanensis TaxID=2486017 RepID=UPI000F744AA5|nr:DUF475 domain-containing protein [Loigolactobacillus zhaoyuanensis]
MLHWLIELYGPFFNLHAWETIITSGADWAVIFSLIMIECLLSVDNAVVLAAQTQKLPTMRQKEQALIYGLWGSYLMRFLMIGLGTFLIKIWWIKVVGALYLLYLSLHFFYQRRGQQQKSSGASKLWVAVIQIVFMDAIFSVDSILAALAVSSKPIIVLIGGLIGILVMRGVAQLILKVMQRIPELEPMAYCLIAIIAVKLFLAIPQIDIEIPAGWFVAILVSAVGITLLIHYLKTKKIDSTKNV